MKKILIPSLIATTSMPLVGLVGCGKEKERDYVDQYLTFTAINDGYFQCDIYERKAELFDVPLDLWYSINNGTWQKAEHNYEEEGTFSNKYGYHKNDVIRFKGENEYFSNMDASLGHTWWTSLHFNGLGNISGNVMSLLYGDNFQGKTDLKCDGVFEALFQNQIDNLDFPQIANANNLILPATHLTEDCYDDMFDHCHELLIPPELPATNLNKACYSTMFNCCSSLQYAPKLTAPLYEECYWGMFMRCTSLKVEEQGDNDHFIFTCPNGIPSGAVEFMFSETGGTVQGSPEAGKTYYWA